MKIKIKKVISFIMSAVMTISALSLPSLNAFAETNDTQTQTSDIQDSEIQYNGILGSMLSDEINESAEKNKEAESLDYTVYKIYHDPETSYVGVDYKAKNDCTLFVGFYNDEGTELLSSVTKELQATDNGFTEMYVLDVLPDHYLVKAFIIGKELLNPLSKPCYYNNYTKQMQEILAKTTDNFDDDKVINLDNSKTDNFLVTQNDYKTIESLNNQDVYIGTNENGDYLFENVNQIANLTIGDDVLIKSNDDILIFRVEKIGISGTNATITPANLEIEEMFSFVKFDSSTYNGKIYKRQGNVDSDSPYEQEVQEVQEEQNNGYLTMPHLESQSSGSHNINVGGTFEFPIHAKKAKSNVEIGGLLTLSVNCNVSIFYEFHIFNPYIAIQCEVDVSAELDIYGELEIDVPLTWIEIGVWPVFGFACTPHLNIKFTAKFGVTVNQKYSLFYTPNLGLMVTSHDPTYEYSPNTQIQVTAAIVLESGIFAIDKHILFFSLEPNIGFELTIKQSDVTNTEYSRHDCSSCYSITLIPFVRFIVSVQFLTFSESEFTLGEINCDLIEGHLSFINGVKQGLQKGKCENISHKIKIKVIDSKENKPVQNAALYQLSAIHYPEKPIRDSNGTQYKTDKNGEVSFFVSDRDLADDAYKIIAKTEDGEVGVLETSSSWNSDIKSVKEYTIDIHSIKSNTFPQTSGKYVTDDVDTITGVCGYAVDAEGKTIDDSPTVYYSIYPDADYDNVCYIYGGGIINAGYEIPENVDKIVIADTNTKLGDNAFSSRPCSHNVKSIDISAANMTEIPKYAFSHCIALKEIKLPLKLERIGYDAFEGCRSLKSIKLPDTVKYINREAFNNCISLTSFTAPPNLKEIGLLAFYGCINLREVNLNYGLEYIGSKAFFDTKLKSINIPSTVNKIGYDSLFADTLLNRHSADYKYLRTVIINSDFEVVKEKDFYNSDDYDENKNGIITDIDANAESIFYECSDLNRVIINEGVTKINDGLFKGRPVTQVSLPSTLKEIGMYAFFETKITSISLPNGLETIGEYAFNTTGLRSVTFPYSLQSIGDYAFANTPLVNVDIPENVTQIGKYAFNFNGLQSITINNSKCVIGEGAIPKGKNYIVYGHDGSTAQAFAESNNNTFISLDTKPAQTTTTTVTTTTAATTTVTATVSTVISPQKECVFIAVNDPSSVNSTAQELLDVDNVNYFDQQTADENGTVIFSFVPDIVNLTHLFISEITDSMVTQTIAVPGEDIKTTQYMVADPTTTTTTATTTTAKSTTATTTVTTTTAKPTTTTTTATTTTAKPTTTTTTATTTTAKPTTTTTTATKTTTATTTAPVTTTTKPMTEMVLGDVDGNGILDAVDASRLLANYAKYSTGGAVPSEKDLAVSDVNKDGFIDAVDASNILSYYAYTSTTKEKIVTLEEYLKNRK